MVLLHNFTTKKVVWILFKSDTDHHYDVTNIFAYIFNVIYFICVLPELALICARATHAPTGRTVA